MTIRSKVQGVGAVSAQLSSQFTFLERTQLNAAINSGSLGGGAGKITGDVTKTLSGVTAKQKSILEIGSQIAINLEQAGVQIGSTQKIIDTAVKSTVYDQTPLPQIFPELPVDLSIASNRIPDVKKKGRSPQKIMEQKKQELLGKLDYNYEGLAWPPDIDANSPAYIRLKFYKYSRANQFVKGTANEVLKIDLPLPENFSTSFSVKYQERDTGQLGNLLQGKAGNDAAQAATDAKGGPAKRVGAAINSLVDTMMNTDSAETYKSIKDVAERALFTELASAEEVVGGLAEQFAGAIPNPHPSVFFKGMDLRTFQWTWKFVPRSQREAEVLQKILKELKIKILPRKEESGSFLQYPHLIEPQVQGKNTDMYGIFKKAFVRQFSINYTGEGSSAFFVDGNPVSIICSMEFQEVENFTSEDAEG
jgi:hypothetical protein